MSTSSQAIGSNHPISFYQSSDGSSVVSTVSSKSAHIRLDQQNNRLWEIAKGLNEVTEIIFENGTFGQYWGKSTGYNATHFSDPFPHPSIARSQYYPWSYEPENLGDQEEHAKNWSLPVKKLTFVKTTFNDHSSFEQMFDHFPQLEELKLNGVILEDLRRYARVKENSSIIHDYVSMILKKMPSLKTVYISNMALIHDPIDCTMPLYQQPPKTSIFIIGQS